MVRYFFGLVTSDSTGRRRQEASSQARPTAARPMPDGPIGEIAIRLDYRSFRLFGFRWFSKWFSRFRLFAISDIAKLESLD